VDAQPALWSAPGQSPGVGGSEKGTSGHRMRMLILSRGWGLGVAGWRGKQGRSSSLCWAAFRNNTTVQEDRA
jgi:hypothetical protein